MRFQGPFKTRAVQKGIKVIRVSAQQFLASRLVLWRVILIRSKGWWPRGKKKALKRAFQIMEAGVGIEPAYTVLQTAA